MGTPSKNFSSNLGLASAGQIFVWTHKPSHSQHSTKVLAASARSISDEALRSKLTVGWIHIRAKLSRPRRTAPFIIDAMLYKPQRLRILRVRFTYRLVIVVRFSTLRQVAFVAPWV